MIFLVMISTLNLFLSVVSQQSSPLPVSDDSNQNFKIILALIVAIVLIVTILVIVIIVLFALSGKSKKRRQRQLLTPPPNKRKTSEEKDKNNAVIVEKGQTNNEKANTDLGASGSFIFSGYASDKPIPIEETYATALQDTDASQSGLLQRPTDLNVKKPSNSKSVVIKDNKSKSGL